MPELRQPIETLTQLIFDAIGDQVNDGDEENLQPRIFLGFDAHSPTLPYVTLEEIDTLEFKASRGGVDGGSNTGLSEKRVQVAIYSKTHSVGVRLRQALIDAIGHTGEAADALPLRISDIVPDFMTYQHDAEERWHKFTVDFILQVVDSRTQGER